MDSVCCGSMRPLLGMKVQVVRSQVMLRLGLNRSRQGLCLQIRVHDVFCARLMGGLLTSRIERDNTLNSLKAHDLALMPHKPQMPRTILRLAASLAPQMLSVVQSRLLAGPSPSTVPSLARRH